MMPETHALIFVLLRYDMLYSYISVLFVTLLSFQCVWKPTVRPQVNPHLPGPTVSDFDALGF